MIAAVEPLEAAPSAPLSADQVVQELQQSISATRLTMFLGCRLRFFFRYVAGLKKPKTPALHVGSAVHAVLKAWNKARWRETPLTLTQLHQEYARAWAESEEPVQWAAGEEDDVKKETTRRRRAGDSWKPTSANPASRTP